MSQAEIQDYNLKTAGVAPFRPVNADPEFIAANQEWHDAEKANIKARRTRMQDPVYQGMLANFTKLLGLG